MKTPLALTLVVFLLLPWMAVAEESPKTLEVGAAAPPFRLEGVDGKWYTLADFAKAKLLAVVFTCNHCPTAQAYEERIKTLVSEYKPKGLALVAISPNDENSVRLNELGYTDLSDSFAEMKVRAKHKQFNFPYLYEGDRTGISRAYGPTATPHVFLFDAARKLRYVGRIDDSERPQFAKTFDLRNAIDALLAGNAPPVAKTRAFGCSIKWAGKAQQVKDYMAKLDAEPVEIETVNEKQLVELRRNADGPLRLVNLWATWCGPCIVEFPELVTIRRMYGHRDFELVTVAAQFPDEKEEVLKFLRKQHSSGRNLIFEGTDKYKMMEAFDKDWNAALPYTLLIAPGGKVLYKKQGQIDALELKRVIVASLRNDRK